MVPLAIAVTTLGEFATFTDAIPDWYLPAVLSFFSLSLVVNALVTGLIISKILIVYREIRIQGLESPVSGLGRKLVPVLSILIESGMITLGVQLIQTLMFKFDSMAYGIIHGLVVMLYVRCFTVNCWCLTKFLF